MLLALLVLALVAASSPLRWWPAPLGAARAGVGTGKRRAGAELADRLRPRA